MSVSASSTLIISWCADRSLADNLADACVESRPRFVAGLGVVPRFALRGDLTHMLASDLLLSGLGVGGGGRDGLVPPLGALLGRQRGRRHLAPRVERRAVH